MHRKQCIWEFFAHTSIIVGAMFVVFFIIDRFNPEMEFLTSDVSRWMILFLALCAIVVGLYSAIFLFQMQKRLEEKRSEKQARLLYGQESTPRDQCTRRNDGAGVGDRPESPRVRSGSPSRDFLPAQNRFSDERVRERPVRPDGQPGSEKRFRDPYQG
ncbi:MAG: hypothetical protein VB034_12710 [Eubacteriales bacterium]|nr:hypothetical protein [Eubacteriales bacterium]